jgi:hypothetical protein
MLRRIPLWVTLVPLVVGVGIYYLLWQGWARDFSALVAEWIPEAQFSVSGFPYRLEADARNVSLAGGDVVKLAASSPRIRINRGPWQAHLTVIAAQYPRFSAVVGPGLGASFSGKSAMSSINVEAGKLVRLSSVIEAANARLGFTSAKITADSLELHARERFPDPAAPASAAPTQPVRGHLVVAAQRIRFDAGDALTLAGEIAVTGPARLNSFDRWVSTGTIELTRLSIADARGEVAGITATMVPIGRQGLRFAGTIETICPASVEAAFLGLPPVHEMRLRAPVRLAFDGMPGAVRLTGMPDNLVFRATRGQLPPCPVLRGRG